MVHFKEILYVGFGLVVVLFILSMFLNNSNYITGFVTSTGTANLTWAGTAGITLIDNSICFGSGYFNSSCVRNYATLDSNTTYHNATLNNPNAEPYCWINTTAINTCSGTNNSIGNDIIALTNSGSSAVNVSASTTQNGETWLCDGTCATTNLAQIQLLSYNNASELGSCVTGLTSGYENLATYNTFGTVGLCDNLDYSDLNDTINIFVNASIPKDTTSGTKTLNLTFEALAL